MYPKIFTHCSDHNSKVVVANAEQEAQLPAEYLPAVAVGAATISAADQATAVMLSPEYSKMLADIEQLNVDRAALEVERQKLKDGYLASVKQLEQDRAQLDADRAQLAADRQAQEDPQQAATGTTDSAAPPADTPAPAKRVRHARAE